MLLFEAVPVALADLDDGAHVDLVERREDRRGVLRLLQPGRDSPAQTRHLHPFLAPVAGWRRGRDGRSSGLRLRGCRRSLCFRPFRGQRPCRQRLGAGKEVQHVLFGDATVPTAGRDLGRVEAVLGDELAHRRSRTLDRFA